MCQCWIFCSGKKSISRKKIASSNWESSVSCTSQDYDNVTTPHNPIYCLLSVKWLLTGGQKQKKMLNLQMSMRRGHLKEVPNTVIWLGNSWYLEKLAAEERWSLSRGDHCLWEVVTTNGSNVVAISNTWCKLDNLQGWYKELSNHSVSQYQSCHWFLLTVHWIQAPTFSRHNEHTRFHLLAC